MVGGFAVIVGGGAVIGLAASGATGGALSNTLLSSPEYVISECAKFETAFKRIITKTESARKATDILSAYEKSKDALEECVQALAGRKEENADVKKMQLSLTYMRKAYVNCLEAMKE